MYVSPLYFRNQEKQISVVVLALTDFKSVDLDWTNDSDITSNATDCYPIMELGLDLALNKFVFHGDDAPYQAQKLIQKYYREVNLDLTYAEQIDFAREFTA